MCVKMLFQVMSFGTDWGRRWKSLCSVVL